MSRLTLDLSDETDKRLTEIATKNSITKAEAMRRAFALLSVADEEKMRGNGLGIVRQSSDGNLIAVARVVGI